MFFYKFIASLVWFSYVVLKTGLKTDFLSHGLGQGGLGFGRS